MQRATWKEVTKHVMWPGKVVPASRVKARCGQLQITIHRLWNYLKWGEERRERRMVGSKIILVLMLVLIEWIELIVFHPYIFIPMVDGLWNTKHCYKCQQCQNIGSSDELTSEQLEGIIEEENQTAKGAREDLNRVDEDADVLYPDNSTSEFNTGVRTIYIAYEHKYSTTAGGLLHGCLVGESTADRVYC
jgi:hypothetical protein